MSQLSPGSEECLTSSSEGWCIHNMNEPSWCTDRAEVGGDEGRVEVREVEHLDPAAPAAHRHHHLVWAWGLRLIIHAIYIYIYIYIYT